MPIYIEKIVIMKITIYLLNNIFLEYYLKHLADPTPHILLTFQDLQTEDVDRERHRWDQALHCKIYRNGFPVQVSLAEDLSINTIQQTLSPLIIEVVREQCQITLIVNVLPT